MEPIRTGETGNAVTDVQQRLAALGYTGDARKRVEARSLADVASPIEDDEDLDEDLFDEPGVFGSRTEAAVRAFQQDRGLVSDGIVGPDTWLSLVAAGLALGDRLLYLTSPMLRGDDVADLQQRLNRLGFDGGYVDGVFGPKTERALREFQMNVGLGEDGRAGTQTVGALRRLHRTHQDSPAFAVKERASMRSHGSDSFAGVRVLLDPSHGPENPGHVTVDGVTEAEITWAITNRVAGRLAAHGLQPVLSRGPNTSPSPSERARLANVEDVAAIVSIHLNGLEAPEARGAAAYYFGVERYVSERGRWLAQLLVDGICEATGTPNCRIHAVNASLLRESRAPAVMVEPGFATHLEEGRSLAQPEYQAKIAEAITEALLVYLRGHRDDRSTRNVEEADPVGA